MEKQLIHVPKHQPDEILGYSNFRQSDENMIDTMIDTMIDKP